MTKNIKIFLIAFIFSLPFWWGANSFQKNLEDFLFWEGMTDNPRLLTAQIVPQDSLEKLKPIRDRRIDNLEIDAKSTTSVLINNNGNEEILFEKNNNEKLPIASLTKLMTANIVLENYDLSQVREISENAVEENEDFGNLKVGEVFSVGELLYPLLMESSNDAAISLAEIVGDEAFVDLMNLEAGKLAMENTHFVNPTGLGPKNSEDSINYSTATDLIKLTKYLLETKPLIWQILSLAEFDLYSADGVFHHKVKSTNELLGETPSILGGKTGQTPEAKGCLILVLKTPRGKGYLINVILGSEDRFGEMRKLVNWVKEAYKW